MNLLIKNAGKGQNLFPQQGLLSVIIFSWRVLRLSRGKKNIGLPLNLHTHESVSNTLVIKYFRLLFQLISCSINSACSTPSWEDLCCEKGSCSWHRQTKEGGFSSNQDQMKAFWISSLLWFLFSVPVSIQLPQRLSLKYSRICGFFKRGLGR